MGEVDTNGDLKWLEVSIHGLCEHVKAKFKIAKGISKSFNNDIGMKQGCPLSPTLIKVYVDKLEEWINNKGRGGENIAEISIKILLFVDNMTLTTRTLPNLQDHLEALESFCWRLGWKWTLGKLRQGSSCLKKNKSTSKESQWRWPKTIIFGTKVQQDAKVEHMHEENSVMRVESIFHYTK